MPGDVDDYDPLALFEIVSDRLVNQGLTRLYGKPLGLTLPKKLHQHSDIAYVCFGAADTIGMKPPELAEKLKDSIGDHELLEYQNTGPYLNTYFNIEKLTEKTLKMIGERKDEYGRMPSEGKKIILEHTSANPTGPLHVGRTRNPVIGDTMARLLRKRGYDVEVHFYVDDMGKQLVILTWGHDNITGLDTEGLRADLKFVKYYQEANRRMDDDPDALNKINHLISIYEKGEPEISEKVRKNCEAILDGMLESLRRLDVHYDEFDWESKYVREGSVSEVIGRLSESRYTGEENGALYLDLDHFGKSGKENKLYLTRSDGTSLYTTRDIAYHLDKLDPDPEGKPRNMAINVFGEDHRLKAWAVNKCLEILGNGEDPVEVMFYAFVSLPEGKMSTRKGQVVYIDDLIEEAVARAREEVEARRPELPEEIKRGIAEIVGSGAIRYNIIRVQPEKKMVFRWEEALNFEGNSAPFIQYSHARASSILRDLEVPETCNYRILGHESEKMLVKVLSRFPSTIEKAANDRTPHRIAEYAQELASAFNQFYRDCPVLQSEGELRDSRLLLVTCTKIVLRNALEIMGIVAPEEM